MGPSDVDYGGDVAGGGFGGVYGMHCYAVPRNAEAADWQSGSNEIAYWPTNRGPVPGLQTTDGPAPGPALAELKK
jgi:hypothetical protein